MLGADDGEHILHCFVYEGFAVDHHIVELGHSLHLLTRGGHAQLKLVGRISLACLQAAGIDSARVFVLSNSGEAIAFWTQIGWTQFPGVDYYYRSF